jgi:hypothetical protein
MEIIKENWKMVVFVILAIFLLIKLEETSSNGRYIFASDNLVIMDSRNGKIYFPNAKQKDGLWNWRQVYKEVK